MKQTPKPEIVEGLLTKWQPRLGLERWQITVTYRDKDCEEDKGVEAQITDDLKYHDAHLEIFPTFWTVEPWRQETAIIHELVHLLLCPLHPYLAPSAEDALEEVTQTIAMLFYKP